MSATYFILVIFWMFMVIGLIIEGYEAISRSHNSSYLPTPVGTIIYKKVVAPIWQLWILLAIIAYFGSFNMKSYSDYYKPSVTSYRTVGLYIKPLNVLFLHQNTQFG